MKSTLPSPGEARTKMLAAYAMVCVNESDLATFKDYLDDYTTAIVAAAVQDTLAYLGVEDGVEIEVVQLTTEQRQKLEESGTLDDYLMNRKDKDDCDS